MRYKFKKLVDYAVVQENDFIYVPLAWNTQESRHSTGNGDEL